MGNGLPRRTITDPKINEILNNIRDQQTRRAVEELIAQQYIVTSLPTWDDIRVASGTARVQGSLNIPTQKQINDDGSGSTGVYGWAFEDTELQQLFFEVQVPHKWKRGTNLDFHCHWTTATGNAGNVLWGLEYQIFGYLTVAQTDTITSEVVGEAYPTAFAMQITDMVDIDMDMQGVSESAIIACRFYRDPTDILDTLTGDAYLLSMDFHFQQDKMGTDIEYPR